MPDCTPSHGENRRALRNVKLLASVFLISLWGFFAYWAVASRQETLAKTEVGLVQMTHAVEQYARNVVKLAELFQATAERWLDANVSTNPSTDPGFVDLIDDFRRRTAGLIDIRMVTASGDLFYLPGDPQRPLDNVSDREYFKAAMGAKPGVQHIGVPVISRVSGGWRLPITTRMKRPHHGLEVINASVSLGEMTETFENERPKPLGSISLWRDDGILLARGPHSDDVIGKPLARQGSTHLDRITREPSGVFFSPDSPVDGAQRFVSFKRLDGLPLIVVVTATLDDALEPWRRQVIMAAIVLLLVTVWGAVFSRQLVDALRRLAANTRELERLATVDALTGLYNRRHFMETGTHEQARTHRYGSPMALIVVDADGFKQINDTWGHPAGDRVLKGLAHVMLDSVRDQDTVGRLGGEEFAVILPETDQAGAVAIAERMRAAVQAMTLAIADDGTALGVTVSVGIATVDNHNDSFEAALGRADKALYRAKELGRNRVEIA